MFSIRSGYKPQETQLMDGDHEKKKVQMAENREWKNEKEKLHNKGNKRVVPWGEGETAIATDVVWMPQSQKRTLRFVCWLHLVLS